MSFSRPLLLAMILALSIPSLARADGLFIPFIGFNFGGDSGRELSDAIDAKRLAWGASVGWMGGGIIGVEGDFGYSPDFFGKTDVGGSSVLSIMGNVLIGVPFGGQEGFGIRPYALVGAGMIQPEGDAFDDNVGLWENKAAWNFGGGVLMFFTTHTGIRGDVRYFRTFEAAEFLDIEIGDEPGDLDLARASLGFVLRF